MSPSPPTDPPPVFPYNLLTAFYFRVRLGSRNDEDFAFLEVSGVGESVSTEDVTEGGENNWVWKLPVATKQQNLVLKRGVGPSSSDLIAWCKMTLEERSWPIQTKDVTVELLDAKRRSVKSWQFLSAYPVKWQLEALNAKKNEVALETIELAYHGCRCDITTPR